MGRRDIPRLIRWAPALCHPCGNGVHSSQTKLQANGAEHRVKIVFAERPRRRCRRRLLTVLIWSAIALRGSPLSRMLASAG